MYHNAGKFFAYFFRSAGVWTGLTKNKAFVLYYIGTALDKGAQSSPSAPGVKGPLVLVHTSAIVDVTWESQNHMTTETLYSMVPFLITATRHGVILEKATLMRFTVQLGSKDYAKNGTKLHQSRIEVHTTQSQWKSWQN